MNSDGGFWLFATAALREGVSLIKGWFQKGSTGNDFPKMDAPLPPEIDIDPEKLKSLPFDSQFRAMTSAVSAYSKILDDLPPISDRLSAVPHLLVELQALECMNWKHQMRIARLEEKLQAIQDRLDAKLP